MEFELFTLVEAREVGAIILRTSIIFIYAFILLRLLGKRSLSHLSYMDLLLVIAFGSAVGDVMIYNESTAHLISSMVAITVVSLLVKLMNELSSHSHLANELVDGHARLVVDKGVMVPGALAREDLTMEKFESYLREKGVDSVKKVRKAFVEPDGEISVIPYKK